MKEVIDNSNPYLYLIRIEQGIFTGDENVQLSLFPISFFNIEKDGDGDTERVEPVVCGNDHVTLYVYVDLRTGFCWDKHHNYYTNWYEAIISTINFHGHRNDEFLCALSPNHPTQNITQDILRFEIKKFVTKLKVKIIKTDDL